MDSNKRKPNHLRVIKDEDGDQRTLYPRPEAFRALYDDLLTIYVKTEKHFREEAQILNNNIR